FRVFLDELWMLQGHFRVIYKDVAHAQLAGPAGTSTLSPNISVRYQTNVGSLVPMYRLFNVAIGLHLLTTSPTEYAVLGANGWNQEGQVGTVMNGPAISAGVETIPFYRMFTPGNGDHFWSTSRNEYFFLRESNGAYNAEHLMRYVFPSQVAGTKPLFRLSLSNGAHLFSSDQVEYDYLRTHGWTDEGIMGYIGN